MPRTAWATLTPLVVVAAYYVLVAAFVGSYQLIWLTLDYFRVALGLLFITALVVVFAILIVKMVKRDLTERAPLLVKRLVIERWRHDYGLSLVVSALVLALLLPSFNAFKQMILPHAGFGLDPLFVDWDRLLFLGYDPWRVSHTIFSGPSASWWLNFLYHPAYFPMVFGVSLCAVLPIKPTLRTQYLLCYALVWILIGSLMAFLLPSAGPVFWHQFHGEPDPFAPLVRTLSEHDRALELSAVHYQAVLGRAFDVPKLALGRGISAMPSVHIALAVLFACGAFAIHRWLGWVFGIYAVAIWIGSIHLGWHYAVDGIVAAVVVVPVWALCGAWARRLHGTPPNPLKAVMV